MKVPDFLTSKFAAIGLLLMIAVAVLLSALVRTPKSAVMMPQKKEPFKVVLDTSQKAMYPYTTDPINSLDQYELEAVFQNEGDRELKKQQINQLTRRFPLDWSFLPPSASRFQSEQAKYIEGFASPAAAASPNLNRPYRDIGDGNLVPPDTLEMEKEEKRILSAYAPKKAQDLTTYDIEDAQTLVNKIYAAKGQIPKLERREGNVFEVVSTRNVNEKIEYEDDLPVAPTSDGPISGVGEATIQVPPTATETAAGRDPFYEATTSTRSDRTDYTRWTPGLERMFAPTYPTTDWIGQPRDRVAAYGAYAA